VGEVRTRILVNVGHVDLVVLGIVGLLEDPANVAKVESAKSVIRIIVCVGESRKRAGGGVEGESKRIASFFLFFVE
jgi:hypothetical protein